MSTTRLDRQRGLTIIELVLFMVIMGVAAAGIIGVLNIGSKSSADPLRRKQAMLIAEAFMEEVQMAAFTYCVPSDTKAPTATAQTDCSSNMQETVTAKAGLVRPYGNVADYAPALASATRSFSVGGADLDINGRPLGQDIGLNTMGNSSLAGITTTVTLSDLPVAQAALGPAGAQAISSSNAINGNLAALLITITTTYGTGPNDFVRLDSYRTRYAPNNLP